MKIKISSDNSLYLSHLIAGLQKFGIEDIEKVSPMDVDGETVFVGETLCLANRKRFNKALFSVGIGPKNIKSDYVDLHFTNLTSEDLEFLITALIIARLFGDTDETILQRIKNFLAPLYAIDQQNWDAHADIKWIKHSSVYATVYNFIKCLVEDAYYIE